MKKILYFLSLFVMITAFTQNVQAQTRMTNPNGYVLDTATNTTAEGPVIQLKGYAATSSFSIVLTKISGTVAGTTQLYGSNDGVTYGPIGSASTNTDVASQTWTFSQSPKAFLYYKVLITGAGTMSASYKAYAYTSKP